MKRNRVKNECKKYELAITDYVLGEVMNVSNDELFNHLRECKKCRDDLYDWQNTYAAMCTREYFSRPETKKKMAEMIENVKRQVLEPSIPLKEKMAVQQPMPGVVVDIKQYIRQDARTLYDLLGTNGVMSVPEIIEKTKLKEYRIQHAICWLGITDKIIVSRDTKTAYVQRQPETRIQL